MFPPPPTSVRILGKEKRSHTDTANQEGQEVNAELEATPQSPELGGRNPRGFWEAEERDHEVRCSNNMREARE